MELSRRVVVALLCRPRHQHCWLLPAAACAGAHPPPHHHDAAADSATPQDVQPCHPPQGQDRRCAGALPERSPPRLLNPVGLRGFASQGAAASADKKPLPPEQRSRSDGGVDPALFGGLSTAGPRARFYKAVSVAEAKVRTLPSARSRRRGRADAEARGVHADAWWHADAPPHATRRRRARGSSTCCWTTARCARRGARCWPCPRARWRWRWRQSGSGRCVSSCVMGTAGRKSPTSTGRIRYLAAR